jgi:DNA-binding MarR family transcriptional regulator
MTAVEPRLDSLLVDPTRLSIVAVLANSHWPEFSFIRDGVGVSDSALSKQISTLEKNHYVQVKKGYVGKRPRTWINITETGLQALNRHVRALERIVQQSSTHRISQPPA